MSDLIIRIGQLVVSMNEKQGLAKGLILFLLCLSFFESDRAFSIAMSVSILDALAMVHKHLWNSSRFWLLLAGELIVIVALIAAIRVPRLGSILDSAPYVMVGSALVFALLKFLERRNFFNK